jgi:hypothetical protein
MAEDISVISTENDPLTPDTFSVSEEAQDTAWSLNELTTAVELATQALGNLGQVSPKNSAATTPTASAGKNADSNLTDFDKAWEQYYKTVSNVSANAGKAFSQSLTIMSKDLETFFETGEIQLNQFLTDVLKQLEHFTVQSYVIAPLMALTKPWFFPTEPGSTSLPNNLQTTTSPITLSAVFNVGGNGVNTAQQNSSVQNDPRLNQFYQDWKNATVKLIQQQLIQAQRQGGIGGH